MNSLRPPPPQLLELLAERRPAVTPWVLALREMLLHAAPEAQELIYSNYAVIDVFTFTGRQSEAFCHIVAYEKHVNLGFNQGASLADPQRLLVGEGKKIRHIRIASGQDLQLTLARISHRDRERWALSRSSRGALEGNQ